MTGYNGPNDVAHGVLPAACGKPAVPEVVERSLHVIVLMPLRAENDENIMRSFCFSVVDTEFVAFESVVFTVIPAAHHMLCAAMIIIYDTLFDDRVVTFSLAHDPIHSLSAGIPGSAFPPLLTVFPAFPLADPFRRWRGLGDASTAMAG